MSYDFVKLNRDMVKILQKISGIMAVSYTHLDVYKRQVSQDSVDRYYIQKEVINGKLKHISSEQTTESCMWWWCAYGYKPLIYLYPEQEQDITVHLPLKWEFIISYPKIGTDQSWKVKAKPDGNLISYDDKREYSYLFREGKFKKPWIIQEWFVVKKEDTISFLQDKLAYLWLTPKEYNLSLIHI